MRLQRIHPNPAFVGCQRASHHRHLMFWEDCAQRFPQRFCRCNKAAENDRFHAVLQQGAKFGDKLPHLRIVITPAAQGLCKVDQTAQRSPLFAMLSDITKLALREQLRKRSQTAQELGMSETAMALYGLLHGQHAAEGTLDEAKKALSENILAAVGELVRIVDWTQKDDVQRELRSLIKRNLAATGMVYPERGELALKIMQLLKVREGR